MKRSRPPTPKKTAVCLTASNVCLLWQAVVCAGKGEYMLIIIKDGEHHIIR